MRKHFKSILIAAVAGCMLLPAGAAMAASGTANATITCTVGSEAAIVLGANTVTFNNTAPSTGGSAGSIQQVETGTITAYARTADAGAVAMTVIAGGDLTDGTSDTIPISNITWTVTGTGYVAGTLSSTTAQSVGSWTGSGIYSGTVVYSLLNSWTYPDGTYTQTITYTLTSA